MSLSSLEGKLRSLQLEKKQCETEREKAIKQRDKAQKRMKPLKKIKNDLEGDFDNNVRGINQVAELMKNDAEDGIKGISNTTILVSTIGANKELFPDVDEEMSNAAALVSQEYHALEEFYREKKEEIDRLNNKINSLRYQIIQTQAAIVQEEARLAAEEAKRQIVNKLTGGD